MIIRSIAFDVETFEKLTDLQKSLQRSRSATVRLLIKKEYKKKQTEITNSDSDNKKSE